MEGMRVVGRWLVGGREWVRQMGVWCELEWTALGWEGGKPVEVAWGGLRADLRGTEVVVEQLRQRRPSC